jgi:hypothetical protein
MEKLNVMSVGAFKSHMTSLSGFGRAVDVGLVGALYSAAMHVELHGNTECMSVLLRKTPRVYAEGVRVAVAAMFAGSLVVTSAGNMSFVRGNAIALRDRLEALAHVAERNQGATSRSMSALVAGWIAENKAVAVAAKCSDAVAGSTSDEGEGTGNVAGSVGRKAGKGERPWVLTDRLGAFLDSASKHGCSAEDVQTALAAIVGNMKAAIVQLEAKAREAKEGAVIEAFVPVAGEADFIGPVQVIAPSVVATEKAKRSRVGARKTAIAVKQAA